MITISLLNGEQLKIAASLAVRDILSLGGIALDPNIIAAEIDGELVDLSYLVDRDINFRVITLNDQRGLEILRHSVAHLLAHAITELFPEVQVTLGPAIKDGFYHDFYSPYNFTEEDLPKIEAKMLDLVKANYPILRTTKSREEALSYYRDRGENYKVMMIEELTDESIYFYSQGNFTNACRGPHVPNTSYLGAFRLTKLSGAYWKNDSKNEMLGRIYGTAWATPRELDDYLDKLEKAKLADHRLIAKKMDLFHLQEEAPGMIFWHPNGWIIYTEIKKYLISKLLEFGYQEVNTPVILDRSLWEKSGHWESYKNSMFISESENRTYAIKPMNCPGHIQIFKQGLKSYRDLPIRYSEFGYCHRNEISGSLHGLMRVRGFTQDDGHIFCTEAQIAEEGDRYVRQAMNVLADFGFETNKVTIKLSTRPKDRIGTDDIWDKAEQALIGVLDKSQINWETVPGEGAFYGPKVEFSLQDSLGRIWQVGTLQVDFFMPERLEAYYINELGEKKPPVMLHRAMIGSLERFIGILLEDSRGSLPFWLIPLQVVVINITSAQEDYALSISEHLKTFGYRVNCDLRNEKIGFKIREHSIAKVGFILVVGNKEMENNTVSVRTFDGKNLEQISVEKLMTEVMISSSLNNRLDYN